MAAKPPAAQVPKSIIRAELNTTLGYKLLREAADRLQDRTAILNKVARFGQEWEKEVFDSRGAVTGKAWAPLARSTSGRPLVREGTLRAQLTGAPRIMKASVQLRAPEHAQFLAAGRYGPRSKDGTGRRSGVSGLGGSMPRRHPAPRPPKERMAILTADLLGGVLPRGSS